jgi:hypothetical protein
MTADIRVLRPCAPLPVPRTREEAARLISHHLFHLAGAVDASAALHGKPSPASLRALDEEIERVSRAIAAMPPEPPGSAA